MIDLFEVLPKIIFNLSKVIIVGFVILGTMAFWAYLGYRAMMFFKRFDSLKGLYP